MENKILSENWRKIFSKKLTEINKLCSNPVCLEQLYYNQYTENHKINHIHLYKYYYSNNNFYNYLINICLVNNKYNYFYHFIKTLDEYHINIELIIEFYDLNNNLISFYKDSKIITSYDINYGIDYPDSWEVKFEFNSESFYNYLRKQKGYIKLSFNYNIPEDKLRNFSKYLSQENQEYIFSCMNNPKHYNKFKLSLLKKLVKLKNLFKKK